MLGLFDSGLGGLTVLRRLRALLPKADVLYFADQANVPYGDRSANELRALLAANVAWLNDRGCSAIVMACNTSCAIASSYGWPPSEAPIFDLIESAADAVARSAYRRVAVVATAATVRSGAYARAIHARVARTQVVELAAPALVPLIESGAGSDEIEHAVAAVCSELPHDADAMIYGCTHYPLVDGAFARVLPPHVARLDPAIAQAERTARTALKSALHDGSGFTRYVTSGSLAPFAAAVASANGGRQEECVTLETEGRPSSLR